MPGVPMLVLRGAAGILAACAGCGRIGFATPDLGPGGDAPNTGDGPSFGDSGGSSDMVTVGTMPITFDMGCVAADTMCATDETPNHAVTLSPYEIERTEVTQVSYAACITAGACTTPQTCSGSTYDPIATPKAPVTCVRKDQAIAYCAWIGARLPTEAEWELAAHGTDGRIYPWGNTAPDCTLANLTTCPDQMVHDVGTYPTGASPYGLLDMAGNAWEWTNDFYSATYYATSPTMDPQGPATGAQDTERGGGFFDQAVELRGSNRRSVNNVVNPDRGLRCARSL